MINKDLMEIQENDIENIKITLSNGQKKQFNDRYLLFIVESLDADRSPIGNGAVTKVDTISDDELLSVVEVILAHLLQKGSPVVHIMLDMINDIYKEVNNESGENQ